MAIKGSLKEASLPDVLQLLALSLLGRVALDGDRGSHRRAPPAPRALAGIVTPVKLLQPRNAYRPMLVTRLGIVTLVRLVQESKAPGAMVRTLSAIVTLVRLAHSRNP